MATKRSTSSASASASGAAPARAKSTVTRKHRNSAVTSENALAPSSAAAAPAHDLAFDDIAQLAYSYWESRGYQGGSSEDDWLRAEQELRASLTMSVAN